MEVSHLRHAVAVLDSSSGSASGLFCCIHSTTLQEVLRLPSAFFFHPPSATLYSLVLFYYLRILDTGSRGSPQAPYSNSNLGNPHCGFLLLLISSVFFPNRNVLKHESIEPTTFE
jgi:hypothetical protein